MMHKYNMYTARSGAEDVLYAEGGITKVFVPICEISQMNLRNKSNKEIGTELSRI